MLHKIDYSQYSTWMMCPWKWYENYVKGMSKRYVGQRDDALALGALTHNLLDNLQRTGRVEYSPDVLLEINPTPECRDLGMMLVRGYVMKFPQERWEMEYPEEAVEFPLYTKQSDNWNNVYIDVYHDFWTGIAKLDRYFYVPEDTTIESGQPGQTITLGRGWWSQEFKTKSHGIRRDVWIKEWMSKRQADFQLLALQAQLGESKEEYRGLSKNNGYVHEVRGVLVSVLEKPRDYTPMRKCKGCGGSFELESFIPHEDGHMCPMCGNIQKLKPYTPTVPSNPDYFRIIVTRTPAQLETARQEIAQVTIAMEDMMEEGMESVVPNRDNCITNRYHTECLYAENHTAGNPVAEPQFIQIDPYKYIGLQ